MTRPTPSLAVEDLPIIDIAPMRDGSAPHRVARELLRAGSEVGFLYVANHGVDETILAQAHSAGLAFFRLPDAEKQAASTNAHLHGYLGPGSTRMYDGAEVDLKESFNWGIKLTSVELEEASENPLIGPNRWPPSLPSLETSVHPFFEAASDCAEDLLRGFAIGAGLDPEHFITARDRPVSRGSLQYYPPQPRDAGDTRYGVSAHTDFGMLTVLCQDSVGGLEVQRPNGQWVAVPPVKDTFVVNVGDLLDRWSNGRFRSTPHRVINLSGQERLSLVLAYDPNFETIVDPEPLRREGDPPARQCTTCGDYLLWRFGKAFSYRQSF